MKRSDFIKIYEQRVRKNEIVTYWPNKRQMTVSFRTNEANGFSEYVFDGTLSEFEALLFDDENERRDGRIEALLWVEESVIGHGLPDIQDAIVRLMDGGDL